MTSYLMRPKQAKLGFLNYHLKSTVPHLKMDFTSTRRCSGYHFFMHSIFSAAANTDGITFTNHSQQPAIQTRIASYLLLQLT